VKLERPSSAHESHTLLVGINSDPLTQFACAFAALTHDVDHHGVPNSVLVREEAPLAIKYKNKSILEQNSLNIVWEILMKPEFEKLLHCICSGRQDEFLRFRALYVNAMMATDILDVELGSARTLRWNKAFSEGDDWGSQQEGYQVKINRKATIVVEHLMQASDLSHTMQHWHIYLKWNENLFRELYQAFKDGRLENDPSTDWYREELAFFDDCVIPLAKKLFACGVFGVSSDELLNYALINRREWSEQGEIMVEQYLKNFDENVPNDNDCTCHDHSA
jgi:3'5'-cyclic nucleotide phosphodiesterase